jgi:hypothetical protein
LPHGGGFLLALLLLVASRLVVAGEGGGAIVLPVAERPNPCDVPGLFNGGWLDRTHERFSENVCGAAMWFDSFFGNERAEAETLDRYIKVISGLRWSEDDGLSSRTRVRARIDLPRLKHYFNLILSNEDEDDVTRMVPDLSPRLAQPAPGDKPSKYALAVRWTPIRGADSAFSTSAGINFGTPLKPYITTRYRYTYGIREDMLARLTQSVFWKNQEGFGENTRFDLERLLDPQHLLRGTLSATFSELSDGLEWNAAVSLYRNVSQKQAWSYNLSIHAATRPDPEIRDYTASVRYRRNIFRPWLFVEVEPSFSWLKAKEDTDYHRSLGIGVFLEAHFGRKRDPFDMF